MSLPAPPDEPAARGRDIEGTGRALLVAASGSIAATLWIALGCQLLTLLAFLLTRTGDLGSWARGGLLLTALSARSEATATIPGPPGLPPRARPIEVTIVFVPMLATLAFAWLEGRAGRRAADQRPGRGAWLTVGSAALGAGAAAAPLGAVAAAGGRLSLPTLSLELAGDPASAALWTAVIAGAAAGGGAAVHRAGGSTAGRIVRGGLVGYGWALLLLVVGVLAVAALEPRATRAYVRALGAVGPLAPAAFGVHVLALPAQSALLQAPAAGACLDVVVGARPAITVCPWRLDAAGAGVGLVADGMPLSPWLWALSTVPPISALLGGRRAALAATGGRALAVGAGAGVAFGAMSLVGVWFAAPWAAGPDVPLLPFAIEVDPVAVGLFASAWGVVGGTVGGWIESRIAAARL